VNGIVTTPMVRAPAFFMMSATTGAAPVPVPPPSPQVMNAISGRPKAATSASRLSSAASIPTSGLPPAPSPPVFRLPICTFCSALVWSSTCLSVLITTNSTPRTPASIIRLTAFPPPPPTPTTLILAYGFVCVEGGTKAPPVLRMVLRSVAAVRARPRVGQPVPPVGS